MPVETYATRAHALWAAGYTDKKPNATKADVEVSETFVSGRPPIWEPDRMRYPLLTFKSDRGDDRIEEVYGNNRLLKIGVIVNSEQGQVYDERFVWENHPKTHERQLRWMILVSRGELDQVIQLIERFSDEPDGPRSLEELTHSLISSLTGEAKEKIRGWPASLKQKHLDQLRVEFGFSFVSELFTWLRYNFPPDKPRPAPIAEFEREFRQKLQKKYSLLQDVRQDRIYEYEKLNESDQVKLKRSGQPAVQRRGFQRRETIWYWLDLDREWP
jgi:hypothetical protein